eukprot:403331546
MDELTNLSDTNLLKSSIERNDDSQSPNNRLITDQHEFFPPVQYKQQKSHNHKFLLVSEHQDLLENTNRRLINLDDNQTMMPSKTEMLLTPDNNSNLQIQNSILMQQSEGAFPNKYLQSNRSNSNIRDESAEGLRRFKEASLSRQNLHQINQLHPKSLATTQETPREEYQQIIDEKNKVIDALRRELTHNVREIQKLKQKHEQEQENLITEYERKIQDTIKETRERVQKVYEKRLKKNGGNEAATGLFKLEDTQNSTAQSDRGREGNSKIQSARLKSQNTSNQPIGQRLTMARKGSNNNIPQSSTQKNSARVKSSLSQSKNNNQSYNDPNEVTFKINSDDNFKSVEQRLHQQYEEMLRERTHETKLVLQKQIREEIEQELRVDFLEQIKHQREVIRKEVHKEILENIQERIDKEVEKRMHENFLDWEEEYKRKKIGMIRDQVVKDVREEYEHKIEELLEQERAKMEEQCKETIEENIRIAREESESIMSERMQQLQVQMERQLDNERLIIRSECLEELRGEREVELARKLREKLTKKIEEELNQQLPREIEGRVRNEVMDRIMQEVRLTNEKQLDQIKRKLEMQRQEKDENMKEKLKRDFDYEVRQKAEEISAQRQKEIVRKYKQMYEREKEQLESRLKTEFDQRIREMKEQIKEEKSQVARLKSLEHIRIRKLQEQKQEIQDHLKVEKLDIERKKAQIEYQARERKVHQLEQDEKVQHTPAHYDRSMINQTKILSQDMGSEQVYKNYHQMSQQKSIGNQQQFQHQIKALNVVPNLNFNQQKEQRNLSPSQQVNVDKHHKSKLMQLNPIILTKESTFNPNVNSPYLGQQDNNYDEGVMNYKNMGNTGTYTDSKEMTQDNSFMNNGQQQDDQQPSSQVTADQSLIDSVFNPKINQNRKYIKPYDSRSLVKQLLKESVEKFQLQSKLNHITIPTTNQSYRIGDGKENNQNQQNTERKTTYDQLLKQMNSDNQSAISRDNGKQHSHQASSTLQSLFPTTERSSCNKISSPEYKFSLKSIYEKDLMFEKEFKLKHKVIIANLEYVLAQSGMSDHGMLEYLLDLWGQCVVAYQQRLGFLQSLQLKDAKTIYTSLEFETCQLADFKNESKHIYKLISRKEQMFGNVLTQKYYDTQHKSELFSLRADILQKIDEFKRQFKNNHLLQLTSHGSPYQYEILWRGINYR